MYKNRKRDNLITIYSLQMAVYLRKNGFDIIKTGINPQKPEFNVWLFEDTKELHEAMSKFHRV